MTIAQHRQRKTTERLRRRAVAWAIRLKVQPKQIRIQAMRRKWASCSTAGWITLASDLVRKPVPFQDYVIVHELLHLRVPNHGRLFKALLRAHLPRLLKASRLASVAGVAKMTRQAKAFQGPIAPA